MKLTPDAEKEAVREFWDKDPCGSEHGRAADGSPEYFAEIEKQRYAAEPFILDVAPFAEARGKRVLEIGVGLGTDHVRFARAGAEVTGVDLTPNAVEMVGRRLAFEGLSSDLRVADAERLPFGDDSFDIVYSWGVLHHTPNTPRAVSEAVRVLRPGGRLCIMLYARHSWVSYGLWVRQGLLKGRPQRTLADVLAHHMESPGTKGYTKGELRGMFGVLDGLEIKKLATPYDSVFAPGVARLTGRQLGFFVVTTGLKP